MTSFRAKPVGWRGESHRHYLAAKGMTSKKYYAPGWRKEILFLKAGIKPAAHMSIPQDDVVEFNIATKDLEVVRMKKPADIFSEREFNVFAISKDKETAERLNTLAEGNTDAAEEFGTLLGYPRKAIKEWMLRRDVVDEQEEDLDFQTISDFMGSGNKKALEEGVSAEDINLLEFMSSTDVEETKREIAKRKAALQEEQEESI